MQSTNTKTNDKNVIVKRIFDQAAVKSETVIAYGRIIIISLMMARFLVLAPSTSEFLVAASSALIGISFSITFLLFCDRNKPKEHWFWLSTIVDVVTAFAIIFNYCLAADVVYRGVLYIPDTVILLIIIFISGFRLSGLIAIFSGLSNSLSLLLVVYIESSYFKLINYEWAPIIMWLIMTGAATLAAFISTMRTRTLCEIAADESLRLEQAKDGVKALLQSHHDAHSILTAVNINTERLIASADTPSREFIKITQELKEDLSVINSCIEQIKHSSDAQIKIHSESKTIPVNATINSLIDRLSASLAPVRVTFEPHPKEIFSTLKGGESTLERILINLINNAYEGAENIKAKNIDIFTDTESVNLIITINDDGAGFSNVPTDQKGTKLSSFGVGLSSIRDLVQRNNGTVQYTKRKVRGTSVTIKLPHAV